ncbi:MAG: PorV/PorQ family protein [Bacillota bacterium]
MKRILLVLTVLNCLLINLEAQIYRGFAQEMFLFSQPDARSEAMGRGSAVLYGSPFTSFYNPASSSFSRGANAEVSHLEFTFPLDQKSNYDVYGAGANLDKYGSISLNYLHYVLGEVFYYTGESDPYILEKYQRSENIFMLNYSRNIIDGLSAGININYFQDKFGTKEVSGWTFDMGLLKKYNFESEEINHDIYLGLGLTNFTNTKISFPVANIETLLPLKQDDYLPSIMRLAAGYEFQPKSKAAGYQLIKVLFTTEYMDLLNSDYNSQFQLGAEITFLEILKLRGGYFTMGIEDYGYNRNVSRLNEATYGLGIELPVKKISNMAVPLTIKFDHTSLPFPTYNLDHPGGKNCPVYTLSASYDF